MIFTERGENIRIIRARPANRKERGTYEKTSNSKTEILPRYDFENGVRGKFFQRYRKGANVVVLDPDVAKLFPNEKIVNRSLRNLAKAKKATA